jgi:hypothetical protein
MDRGYLDHFDRDRYPGPWLCLRPTEEDIQKATMDRLLRLGIKAWEVDAGAKTIRGRAMAALKMARRMDLARYVNQGQTGAASKGFVDIVGVLRGGRALLIECKRPEWLGPSPKTGKIIQVEPAGEPAPEQLAFLDTAHAQGALVGIVWSPNDLDEILARGGVNKSLA